MTEPILNQNTLAYQKHVKKIAQLKSKKFQLLVNFRKKLDEKALENLRKKIREEA